MAALHPVLKGTHKGVPLQSPHPFIIFFTYILSMLSDDFLFPGPFERPLREQVIRETGMVLYALDGQLGPVAGLPVLDF